MLLDKEPVAENAELDQLATCCHHWVIQPAVGPVSEGECQNCGEIREFKNSIDYETEWTARRDSARSETGGPVAAQTDAADSMDQVDEIAG